MELTVSMARRVVAMKNSAILEIEEYILQRTCQGAGSVLITENSFLYKSAINSYEKLVSMGYKVDKYQYSNTEYSGINSIVIYWGVIKWKKLLLKLTKVSFICL